VPRDTWRRRSPPVPGGGVRRFGACGDAGALSCREAGSNAVGLDLSLMRGGTWSAGYRQWPPGPPQERQRTRKWDQYLFPRAAFTIFVLVGFDAVVRFHQRTRGDIRSARKRRGV
jgi:hypothetical protein